MQKMREAQVLIGTSGWNYKHWKGPFYPDDLPQSKWLAYYAAGFRSVEINNTFYNLPHAKTLDSWRESVPDGFVFSVKASRYITHMKKLKDPADSVNTFMKRVAHLKRKLGPILFQLPPGWSCNLERLESFLKVLPKGQRYTFEFRDKSWWIEDVFGLLGRYNVAFCIFELAGQLSPRRITSDFAYIRLHGPGDAYEGSYGAHTLSGWAGAISAWARQHKDVYCYFDNDQNGYAAQNAGKLAGMLNGTDGRHSRKDKEDALRHGNYNQ